MIPRLAADWILPFIDSNRDFDSIMIPPSVAIEIENGGDFATPIKLAFLACLPWSHRLDLLLGKRERQELPLYKISSYSFSPWGERANSHSR